MNRTLLLLRGVTPMLLLLFAVAMPFYSSAQCPANDLRTVDAGQCYSTGITYTNPGAASWEVTGATTLVSTAGDDPAVIPATVQFNVGISTVTFRDAVPATVCTFTVRVDEATPPTATCQSPTVMLDAAGNATIMPADVNNGSVDNCTGNPLTMSVNPSTFNCTNLGTPVVTLTVTDFSGNTGTCSASVTVADNIAPVAMCQNAYPTVNLSATGTHPAISAASYNMGSNDNCNASLMYTASKTVFTCADIGTNVVTLTATDGGMNTATCTVSVTVQDANTPVLVAPTNTTAECSSIPVAPTVAATGICANNVTVVLTQADNQNGADPTDTDSPGYYDYTITRTWTATNISNIALRTQVSQTITVSDNTAPTFMGLPASPINLAADANNGCMGTANLTADASNVMDNCAPSNLITIEQKVDKAGMPAGTFVAYNATDLANFPIGTSMVTFRATDPEGNSSTSALSIVVTDNATPVFNAAVIPQCGTTITLDNVMDNCGNSYSWTRPGFADVMDCSLTSITESIPTLAVQESVDASFGDYTSGQTSEAVTAFFPVGSTTVTYLASDAATPTNTAACTFTVTVEDVQAPTITCPANVTLNTTCPTDLLPDYINAAMATDNCPTLLTVTQSPVAGQSLSTVFGTPMQGATQTVTITATDGMTTPATCTFVVELNDGMAPIPNMATLATMISNCGSIMVPVPTANEQCNPSATVINGVPNPVVGTFVPATVAVPAHYLINYDPLGANFHAITWEYTDGNGNISSQLQSVTVNQDVTPPTALCKNVTVDLPAGINPTASVTAADVNNNSSDACGIASLAVSVNSFDCSNLATANVVTLTVTDDAGNSSTCTSSITVRDRVIPNASCKNITVDLSTVSMASITAADVLNSATDNCSIQSTSIDQTDFVCTDVGVNAVTLTATDNSNNTSACIAMVTVVDNSKPTIVTAPAAAITIACVPAGSVAPTFSDPCGIAGVVFGQVITPGICARKYTVTRTWTATDNNGNSTDVVQVITVNDETAPVFSNTASNITIGSNDWPDCIANLMYEITADSVSDNCIGFGGLTIDFDVDYPNGSGFVDIVDDPAFAINNFPIGTTNVTYRASDGCGTATTSITVTVLDDDAPLFDAADLPHCGNTIVLNNVPGTCGNSFSWTRPGIGTFVDCANITVTEAIDDATVLSSVTQSFGALDVNAPVETVTASFAVGETVISYTAMDDATPGNTTTCSFTIQVNDTQQPMITCPPNLTLNTTCPTDMLPDYRNDVFVADNCSANITVTQSPMAGTQLQTVLGAVPAQGNNFAVTMDVTDGMTAAVQCSFMVTLNDGDAPVPTTATLADVTELCGQLILPAPSATDVCNPTNPIIYGTPSTPVGTVLNTTPPSYQFDFQQGGSNSYSITWVYDDMNGNITTQQQNISVQADVTPPSTICQGFTMTLPATNAPTVSLVAGDLDNGSFDNCGIAGMSASMTTFDCTNVGANTVVLTVTDNAGNSSTCATTITVEDQTNPTATCKNVMVDLSTVASGTITVADVKDSSSDNCSIMSEVLNKTTFDCSDIGMNTVVLTVTDASNNTTTCSGIVTVVDNSVPVAMNVPIDVTVDCAEPAVTNPTFTDPCGVASVVYATTTSAMTCPNTYIATRTWTATDNNGNTSTVTQVVTVQDIVNPTFNTALATAISLTTDAGTNCTAALTYEMTADSVSDNCAAFADMTFKMTVDYPAGTGFADATDVAATTLTSFPLGQTSISYEAADACGNTSIFQTIVTVNDAQAPLINNAIMPHCGNTILLDNTPGTCGNVFTWNRPGSDAYVDCTDLVIREDISNNVLNQSVNQTFGPYNGANPSQMVNGGFALGSTTITYTAQDANNNVLTCSFVVRVQDTQDPTLSCPDTLILATTCVDALVPSYLNEVQVADNCLSNITLTQSPNAGVTVGSQFPGGAPVSGSVFNVQVIASDATPNTTTPASCMIAIKLDDGVAPVPTLSTLPTQIDSCGSLIVEAPTAVEACNPNASIIYGTPSTPVGQFLNTTPPSYQFEYDPNGSNNYVITWIYDDMNGNLASQIQNITVLEDTFPPTAICQPISIPLQADGDTTIAAVLLNNGSFDPNGCGGTLTFGVDKATFSCADLSYDTLTQTIYGLDTVTLSVFDAHGNEATCETTVYVYDETAPFFNQNIPSDTTIQACEAIPAAITVTAFDVCDPNLDVDFTEVSTQDTLGSGIYNYTITRDWYVKDTSGNVSTATQVITIEDSEAPTFTGAPTNLTLFTGVDRVTCDDDFTIDLTSFVADCTPFDSLVLSSDDGIIGNGLVWTKLLAPGTYTATFTARDQSNNVGTHVVNITVLDGTTPIAACVNGISVSLSPSGFVNVTANQVNNNSSDNCTSPLDLAMSVAPSSFSCSDIGPNPPTIRLTVEDLAGNTASCVTFVEIQDNVVPTMNCPADTVVDCGATTTIAALGSATAMDNCSATVAISSADDFTGNICGTLVRTWSGEDIYGNVGTCAQIIAVQDTVAPTFSMMPTNDTLSCALPFPALPMVTISDNCTPNMVATVTLDTIDRSAGACGNAEFTVSRTWSAMDSCGNAISHTQYIRLLDTLPPTFVGLADTVRFYTNQVPSNPDCGLDIDFDLYDYVVDCADSSDVNAVSLGVGSALQGNGAFNLSGYYGVGLYTYEVSMIDGCGNDFGVDTLHFEVIDNTTPQPDCIDQVVVALDSDGQGDLDVDDVNLNSTDNCGLDTVYLTQALFDCSDLGIQMVQMVVVDAAGNSNNCDVVVDVQQGAATTFTASINTGMTSFFGAADGTLTATASGGSGNFTYLWSNDSTSMTIDSLLGGMYTVTISDVSTNCQMILTGEVEEGPAITFTLGNVTAPVGGIAEVPVTASDFDNITQMIFVLNGVDPTVATISGLSNINPVFGNSISAFPSVADNSLSVLWSGGTAISLAPTDVLFTVLYDVTGAIGTSTPVGFNPGITLVQQQGASTAAVPGMGVNGSITIEPSGGVTIAGTATAWNGGAGIENATAKITGQANATTDATGTYSIDIAYGGDSDVSLEKVTAGNAGVTSGDLLRIVNNMFGTPFTSPYQWVAADVNNDGMVTVADITKIQRLALGTVDHLDSLPDWIFVPADYVFPTTGSPIAGGFPTSIPRTNVTQDYLMDNFIGVRRGDVNGNGPVNLLSSDDRFGNNETFKIKTTDKKVKAGTQIEVPFRASNFNQRAGFQMTIDFDPSILSLNHIEAGVLNQNDENFGLQQVEKGQLTTLWYDRSPVTVEDDATLFTLTFDVQEDMTLSKALAFTSDITKAEGYDAFGENMPLELEYIFPVGGLSEDISLLQNKPNPFKTATTIGFVLPVSQQATLRFYNATGKLIKTVNGDFAKGYNEMEVFATELGAAGVYWYEIETDTKTKRKKLVVLK